MQQLIQKVKEYNPKADLTLINKAYGFADAAHVGEKRLNGEPLIHHCLAVAKLLILCRVDSATIAAALLHDVLEKTEVNKKDLAKEFNPTVAKLVDGVSIIKKVKTRTGRDYQVENLRKLFLATAKDVRVVLIRLSEKLHSLQTLEGIPEDLRGETIQKAFEIYAPLAERIGVYYFKWQIEDWAFKHHNHAEHTHIQKHLAETREKREAYIEKVKDLLSNKLFESGIKAEIKGRPKHIYGIYKKTLSERKPGESKEEYLQRLHDKQAFRVLVSSVDNCYTVLGVIHQLWKPWSKFNDYIANPKPNGYRSIHTTVFGPEGKLVELQVKTYAMHEYNEFGPAAHVYYKEIGREKGSLRKAPIDRLSWLRSLVEWQEEILKEKDFEEALKTDVFGDRVFVFTPKGDVKDLPAGSTPIDFAYQVHTELGNSASGAKVDGKLVPLNYQLNTNETVAILISKIKKTPSQDWLKFVKTQEAKSKIRKALKKLAKQ